MKPSPAASLKRCLLAAVVSILLVAGVMPTAAVAWRAPEMDYAAFMFSVGDQTTLEAAPSAPAADDEIPGISVVSPYSGALDLLNDDYLDVLQVNVPAGRVLTAEVTYTLGDTVGGAILVPGSTHVWTDAAADIVAPQSWGETTGLRLSQYSLSGGTYYVVVFADRLVDGSIPGDGDLPYTVSMSVALPGDYSDVGTARLLAASQTDALDWRNDVNDVYYLDLVEGDQIVVQAAHSLGYAGAGLNLWGPDVLTVWGSQGLVRHTPQVDLADFTYLVPPGGDGRYYVEAFSSAESLTYGLDTSLSQPNMPRVSGDNRFLTSLAVSSSNWATADSVVLATGVEFPDALAASAIAGTLDAPVVSVVPQDYYGGWRQNMFDVCNELERLGCSDVYVVGGDVAVGPEVDDYLSERGYSVHRVSGANRYLTAVEVAEELFSTAATDTAFMARGDDFADALAVSPYAFSQGIPVLLTKSSELPPATAAFIEEHNIANVVVAGGEVAVSDAVVEQLEALNGGATNVVRCAGTTRYATAKAVADYAIDDMAWASWDFMGAATGESFPDALSGGAACGRRGGSLLLTKSTTLRAEVSDTITDNDPKMVMIFGGTAAVSSGVATSIQNLMP